jgi:radical SAM protein with 4Fe4S-binding SPASM domain
MISEKTLLTELTIEVNRQCPNTCIFCSSESSPHESYTIDIDTICLVLQQSCDLGLKTLSISGGEPSLHPNINNILQFGNKLGLRQNLYSSGFTGPIKTPKPFSENLLSVIKNTNTTLILNIPSFKKDTYSSLTNNPAGLNILLQSIQYAKSHNIRVEAHCIPLKQNAQELNTYFEHATNFGIDRVSFLRLVPQGRAAQEIHKIRLNDTETATFLTKARYLAKKYPSLKVRFGTPFSTPHKTRCQACKSRLLIRWDGNVFPCEAYKTDSSLSYLLGNINHESIIQIWKSQHKQTIAQKIHIAVSPYISCPAQQYYTTS